MKLRREILTMSIDQLKEHDISMELISEMHQMTAQLFAQDLLNSTTALRSLGERKIRLKRFAALFGEEFPNCINRVMIQVVKCFGVDIVDSGQHHKSMAD
jgi:hypothetical protein